MIVINTVEHVNEYNDNIHHVRCDVRWLYATTDCDSQYGCVSLTSIFSENYFFSLFVADTYSFLGISIVGQTNEDGIGGIYVGTIMKGSVESLG